MRNDLTTIEPDDTSIIIPSAVFGVTLPEFDATQAHRLLRLTAAGDCAVTVLHADGSVLAIIPARPAQTAALSTVVFRRSAGSTKWAVAYRSTNQPS
jgi:hypothetical protein